jgi:4-carboxymuconolactone decarboxylase
VIFRESEMKDSKTSPMFELGFENRKAVLGADHVERSWAAADDFNRPMQELVTEYCWGAIWGRDDLPRTTRSIINIAMLTALNRQHELKVHVRGALVNGVTVEEIRGILLQTAIYCGVPAALEAFRTASEAIKAYTAEKHG